MIMADNGCGHMDAHGQNDWGSIRYDARFDEYSIPAGEGVSQCLFYCPWCGEKLPQSKRDEWFEALETLGLDPLQDVVPVQFQSGAWREEPSAKPE
jgi:hypothetical protein